jgi:subtilase family serine protease
MRRVRWRRIAVAALLALGLSLAACAAAFATPAASRYRVQRLCGNPYPGAASCLAMKLVPTALSASDLHASAVRQDHEAAGGERPAVTEKSPIPGYLTPARLHDAYSLPSESAPSTTQTIAVVDAFDDPTAEADLGVYDREFELPACTSANGCFHKINQEGKAKPLPAKEGEWAGEISIDVQMAHAICQSCKVLLVEARGETFADLGAAVNAAVAAGATVISNSYGGPERSPSSSKLAAEYFEHPGVVITASSGDCGYLNTACAGLRNAAEFPADSPHVVAVGGTSLRDRMKTWTSSAWSEGGSGCSVVFTAALWQSSAANFSATGCGSGRSVADVSAIGDPNTGVDVYDSTPEGNGDPTGWGVWGGTSVSSPIVAAEFALAGGAHGVSYPAATLYEHLGDASALYDVVSGANGSCSGASSCQAIAGYDGPTGVGSPIGLGAFALAGEEVPGEATFTGFTPASAITGSSVLINGSSLGSVSEVLFGKLAASFKVLSPTQIEATVPNGAKAGKITVSSPAASIKSKTNFTPTLSVSAFSPKSGAAGKLVTVTGVGFTSSSSVAFNGVPAGSVSLISASKLKAAVPAGAGSGPITVTNTAAPAGSVSSAGAFAGG